ncbi:hypothetical protein G5C51_32320 [Streptomyces sp. A7024]|uniref:DUF4145 domain-containing protein n=1 Tax=Streptomyces coryli TaxID=1128680 RepID=A0A6G4U8L0_9ACTN|nr:hypothetical protein [Streptomyces coryli]NGN68569.1 hypothetical protein [Streptomyces coryli]
MAEDQGFDFPPVLNGVDYLLSALRYLEDEESEGAGSLKYATLHLQAAMEVLLKVRLIQEHWSLVFREPGKANLDAFKSGAFESCSAEAALDRLDRIVGINIPDSIRKRVKTLAQHRNSLQHYGAHAQSVYAVEALAVEVLDFLLDFTTKHLAPSLSGPEAAQFADTFPEVQSSLRYVESLVDRRMKRITREARAVGDPLFRCPWCKQHALAIEQNDAACRFCLERLQTVIRDEALSDGDDKDPYVCWKCRKANTVIEVERRIVSPFEIPGLGLPLDDEFFEEKNSAMLPLLGYCRRCDLVQQYST